ncbi:Methyltransferase domain-containing protein [Lentzea californiensis]|nr:Methyltransferase domain-containing protein [Lentzea californiensis]
MTLWTSPAKESLQGVGSGEAEEPAGLAVVDLVGGGEAGGRSDGGGRVVVGVDVCNHNADRLGGQPGDETSRGFAGDAAALPRRADDPRDLGRFVGVGDGRLDGAGQAVFVAKAARRNLDEAGLGGVVTILPGDARRTLADIAGPIGLVLLDGWKELCLPVLRDLESRLAPGALVVADDIDQDSMAGYLEYVRDPANGYVSVAFPVEDGMEISCRA